MGLVNGAAWDRKGAGVEESFSGSAAMPENDAGYDGEGSGCVTGDGRSSWREISRAGWWLCLRREQAGRVCAGWRSPGRATARKVEHEHVL